MKPGDLENGPSIRILRALKAGPSDTVALADQLGITRRSAKCALQFLAETGRVVRLGVQRYPGVLGRPPVLFALNTNTSARDEQLRKAEALLRSAGYTVHAPGSAPNSGPLPTQRYARAL